MRWISRFVTVFFGVLCLAQPGVGAVIHVPLEYATIQAGIDAAVDGDTVLVADGTYTGSGNRDIDFEGRAIVVMSENGPKATVIDCEGSEQEPHRGFYFHSGEGSSSVVRGFTITNGKVHGSWPMACGGAILCVGSSPTIIDDVITGNVAQIDGGGIACETGSAAAIVGNVIGGNRASWGGGILAFHFASPRIIGNTIRENAACWGGGIGCFSACSPAISGNSVIRNGATFGGGILVSGGSHPEMTANTIYANVADEYGGGIYCTGHCGPTIEGNTITRNLAAIGGGLASLDESYPAVLNSIFWGDSAGLGGEIFEDDTSWTVVTYSDVEGGWPGEGNIDADPAFCLAERGDFRLLWASPCIDAGHPDSLDPDGTRRDMGTFFFDQDDHLTLYLTPDTTAVTPGGALGVTYTAINRWPQAEPFWVLTQATLPSGYTLDIMGPDAYTLPADFTVQRHLTHDVPVAAPLGPYTYRSRIGVPPSTLYDEDAFELSVRPPPSVGDSGSALLGRVPLPGSHDDLSGGRRRSRGWRAAPR